MAAQGRIGGRHLAESGRNPGKGVGRAVARVKGHGLAQERDGAAVGRHLLLVVAIERQKHRLHPSPSRGKTLGRLGRHRPQRIRLGQHVLDVGMIEQFLGRFGPAVVIRQTRAVVEDNGGPAGPIDLDGGHKARIGGGQDGQIAGGLGGKGLGRGRGGQRRKQERGEPKGARKADGHGLSPHVWGRHTAARRGRKALTVGQVGGLQPFFLRQKSDSSQRTRAQTGASAARAASGQSSSSGRRRNTDRTASSAP